jgi:hypothetical protein
VERRAGPSRPIGVRRAGVSSVWIIALAAIITVAGCMSAPDTKAPGSTAREPNLTGVVSASPAGDVVPPKILATIRQWQAEGTRIDGRIEWIQTTTHRALPILPDVPTTPDVPIYVLQMHGRFHVQTTGGPTGATASRIPFIDGMALLSLTVGTSQIGGGAQRIGRGQGPADLASIASVHSFALPAVAAPLRATTA